MGRCPKNPRDVSLSSFKRYFRVRGAATWAGATRRGHWQKWPSPRPCGYGQMQPRGSARAESWQNYCRYSSAFVLPSGYRNRTPQPLFKPTNKMAASRRGLSLTVRFWKLQKTSAFVICFASSLVVAPPSVAAKKKTVCKPQADHNGFFFDNGKMSIVPRSVDNNAPSILIQFGRVLFNVTEQVDSADSVTARQGVNVRGTPAQFGNRLTPIHFNRRAVKLQPAFRSIPVVAVIPINERRGVRALTRRQFVEVFRTPFEFKEDQPTPQFRHGGDFAASVLFRQRVDERLRHCGQHRNKGHSTHHTHTTFQVNTYTHV